MLLASLKGTRRLSSALTRQGTLKPFCVSPLFDLHGYQESGEFELLAVRGQRNGRTYECCPNASYPDLTFELVLRRKPLFYLVNLVMPCAGISFLAVLVFYLPVCPVALLLYSTYL